MSVQCNQYIAYGYMMEYSEAQEALVKLHGEEGYEELQDKYSDSAFNPDIVEVYGCSMIEDGMNGQFMFFGKVYAKTGNYQQFESMTIPEPTKRDKIITEHEFNRVFGGLMDATPELRLIVKYR